MSNPFRGQAPLMIDGEPVDLHITWDVLGKLVGRFGVEWDKEVNRAFEEYDAATVAEILSITTGKPAEIFSQDSPPWLFVREAWVVAFNLFLWGVPDLAEIEEKETQAAEDKERDPLARAPFWSAFGTLLSRRVWGRASSGHQPSTNALSLSGREVS